jgi:hypothetical protein
MTNRFSANLRVRQLAPDRLRRRTGSALMATMFVMTVTSLIVIAMLGNQTSQFGSLRNTIHYDQARYLAEAGLHHCLSQLESDITWRGDIPRTEFPTGSGRYYSSTAANGAAATVVVTGTGEAGGVVRTVQVVVKQGG